MAKVKFQRGKEANLPAEKDGNSIYFTTDSGKIFMDISLSERKQMYGGKLTIGTQVFDGTSNVTIPVYNGTVE